MAGTQMLAALNTTAALTATGGVANYASRTRRATRTDFDKVITSTAPLYDAALPSMSDAGIKEFCIPIRDATVEIASGVKYQGWTFGGTVPGSVIHVRQGDLVRITVVNDAGMPHSIDFHAARIAANVANRMILPKDSISFEFVARDAGAFLVHCGMPVAIAPHAGHVRGDHRGAEERLGHNRGQGIRDRAERILREADERQHVVEAGWNAEKTKNATYVVFNGRAGPYKEHPLKVSVGDRVRFYVVNAGPNFDSDFHVVGAIFDRVYPDGNPAHALEDVQTYPIPAGGGEVFETMFRSDASGEGIYPFVTHAFADAEKGAVGMIQVGVPKQFATMSH